MKVFGFIFSFYILFLALQPGLSQLVNIGQAEETCCGGNLCEPFEEGQKQDQPDKDADNSCNPFQFCKCCVVYNTNFTLETLNPVLVFAKPKTNITEKVPPHIALDFWQPPKIV